MITVMKQVLIFILFSVSGYLLVKLKLVRSEYAGFLSKLLLYIFLPSMVFRSFSRYFNLENIKSGYILLITSAVILTFITTVAFFTFRFFKKMKSADKNIYVYSLMFSNFGYIGYAFAEIAFGAKAQFDMILFCIPFSLLTNTLGYCMLTSNGSDKKQIDFKRILNPVTVATVLGAVFGFIGIKLPETIDSFLSMNSACMAPLSMILAGMVIADYKPSELFKNPMTYIITLFRNLIIPIAFCLILKNIGFAKVALIPAVLTLCMPVGCNTIMFPKLVEADTKPGASLVIVSTALCIFTIPICVTILKLFL